MASRRIRPDAEKRVIGLQNPTSKLPDHDPDDVGVNQAADPGLPLPLVVMPNAIGCAVI
jgi:hypothetical protein